MDVITTVMYLLLAISVIFATLTVRKHLGMIRGLLFNVGRLGFLNTVFAFIHYRRPALIMYSKRSYSTKEECVYSVQTGMKKISAIFCLVVIVVSNAFASPLSKQVELLLVDSISGMAGVTTVSFVQGTSPNYVPGEDIPYSFLSTGNSPELYSFSQDNVACGTNEFGVFNNTTIVRLAIGITSPTTCIFSLQQFSNFDPSSLIFLEDRQLNIITDLRQSTYSVPVTQTGQTMNRFYLHITYPPVVTSTAAGCTNNDGIVNIIEDSSIVWSAVKIFDSTNTLVAIDTNITGNFNFNSMAGGNYRVEFDYTTYALSQFAWVDEHQLVAGMNVSSTHDYVRQNILFYTANSNADRFNWDFGDGSTITGVANPTYFYLNPGVYHAQVNCSNNFGCSAHSDTTMYIDVANSVNEIDGNKVQMITDSKTVKIEMDNVAANNYYYNVYDIQGQLIKTGTIESSTTLLNFSNEASGAYVIALRSNTSSLSQKVIITH